MKTIPSHFIFSSEVMYARQHNLPIVALESTVITHGLPHPQNLELARQMETIIRETGCTPATIAILDGKVHVGLDNAQLERISTMQGALKISRRDYAPALAQGKCGGTTVAGTLIAAQLAGIKVFATGGIGGVHRGSPFDISADLQELARSQVVVVCAGAKAILDLPATLEVLETNGVPVIGYQTDTFPAFYSLSSGLPVSARADSPHQVAAIAKTHWELGMNSAILLCVPPPAQAALPVDQAEKAISQALEAAHKANIHGAAVTPFLLARMSEITGGASLEANLALLCNNAHIAAQVASALSPKPAHTFTG